MNPTPMGCASVYCLHVASHFDADVPLCDEHYVALVRPTAPSPPPMYELAGSVVYYVAWPHSNLIKIGTTQNITHRLKQLRKIAAKPKVMVTEPGGYRLERSRHYQFRSLRVPGSELFEWAPVLATHIADLRAMHHSG